MRIILLLVCLTLIMTDCREPFLPDFETGVNDYLVVEGFINVGDKTVTKIKLSRVAPLQSQQQTLEGDATLMIEDDEGTQYPLAEQSNGNYQSDSLTLDPSKNYRLLITTSNGNQHASDFAKAKGAPPIDDVSYYIDRNGIAMNVTTHDPENATRYYMWDYVETWEIHSQYVSASAYINGEFVQRPSEDIEKMRICWRYEGAKDLLIASTSQFAEDKIKFTLVTFPFGSDRFTVRYTILVKQRALSKEEFEYLALMKKNSTPTGSLFDPLPSEIHGNLTAVSSNEQVIGFVGVSSVETKRIFIDADEIDEDTAICEIAIVGSADRYTYFVGGGWIPINVVGLEADSSVIYSATRPYCVDCRLRGGKNVRPEFWQ